MSIQCNAGEDVLQRWKNKGYLNGVNTDTHKQVYGLGSKIPVFVGKDEGSLCKLRYITVSTSTNKCKVIAYRNKIYDFFNESTFEQASEK